MSELTVERSISIAASPQKVFAFVSIPGWFINEGTYREHRIDEISGRDFVVHDETHGAFEIRAVTLDEPEYAAFAWVSREFGASTLVEFFVIPEGEGTLLRVKESGFESLSDDEVRVREAFEGNDNGWALELGVAKAHLEPAAS